MCLAIYKPKDKRLIKRYAKNGFYNNVDGAGFAVARDGKIIVDKGFTDFKSFWRAFREYQDDAALVHFRMATHGKTDRENCHPFTLCADTYAVIHNGILDIDTKSDKDKSDTRHFVEKVLEPLLLLNDAVCPAFRYVIEQCIGKYNKLALLRFDGQAVIYNENRGEWNDGLWFSNSDYKCQRTLGFGACTGKYNTQWDWRDAYDKYAGRGKWDYELNRREFFPDYEPETKKLWKGLGYPKNLNLSGMTDEEILEIEQEFELTQADIEYYETRGE